MGISQNFSAESLRPTQAKQPKRLPSVLTKEEVQAVLSHMPGVHFLMAQLHYGGGLRLMECVRLRVKACPECPSVPLEQFKTKETGVRAEQEYSVGSSDHKTAA